MTTFTLRSINGRILGVDAENQAEFAKVKQKLVEGQHIRFKTVEVRNPRHHRLYMAMHNKIFQHNDAFKDATACRHWIEMEAGHFEAGVDKDGLVYKVHKSISYERLDEGEFRELHEKVKETILTESVAGILFHQSVAPLDTAMAILSEFYTEV